MVGHGRGNEARTGRRKSGRSRTYLDGVIGCNGRAATMDSLFRNISARGAYLSFYDVPILPDRFELTIARKDRRYPAQVAWRGTTEAGVMFQTAEMPIPFERARRLRKSEAENAELGRRIKQLSTR
jgi:hypothetical protein